MKTSTKYIVSLTDSRGNKYYYSGSNVHWTKDRDEASQYRDKETAIRMQDRYTWQNIQIEEV